MRRSMKVWRGAVLTGMGVWVLACTTEKVTPTVVTVLPTPAPTPLPSTLPAPAATPAPSPTPDTCPQLTAWTSRIFNITDSLNRSATEPSVGGHVVIDSTPLFGGRECNLEHPNNCGGRHCEDPEGGDWKLLEGDSPATPQVDGYQLRIGPLKAGTHRWRVCPRADARDEDGEKLVIGPNPCSEGTFDVPPQ